MRDLLTSANAENHDAAANAVAPEKLKILLWDIDGTLMRSTVQGAYKEYFSRTMQRLFGSAGSLETMQVSGMTDTQIMYEALRGEGFTPERIFAAKADLLKIFKSEMTGVLAGNGEPYEALRGAREILDETAKNPGFINALLTGNLSVAAEIKLKSVRLWHYFENAPNAFGEVSHDRRELAKEAGRLFKDFYKFDFQPRQFIVIGDTPNDIACARAFGAKAVAVATGRNHPPQELAAYQPDALLEDLRDTKKVLELLENL
ncbi:MAG TPA: HAD hydrolase-like protein [Pyrinomonadaceae bacterium]|nr:HAD hydrolase-like protein [Pyrinomonadaceae bacterium]